MDILTDNSRATLFKIAESFEMPDYVLQSQTEEFAEDAKEAADKSLPDTLFADSVHRAYPVDSKANTWLSAAYFAKTAADDPWGDTARAYTRDNLVRVAEMYGIADDVNKVLSAEKKAAAPVEPDDSDYAYVDDGERLYPMFDSTGVKKAFDHFGTYAYQYPAPIRHKIATGIMRKAAAYGLEAPRTVRVEAHVGIPRRDFVVMQIQDRANRAPTAKLAEAILNTGLAFMESPIEDVTHEMLEKMAEAMSEFDVAAGLDSQYGRKVLPPAEIMFDISPKEAQAAEDDAVDLCGTVFSAEKLAQLPEGLYASALGPDFLKRVKVAGAGIDPSRLSDELYSLPNPDKRVLYDVIAAYAE